MSALLQEVGPDYDRQKFLGSSDIAGVMGISPWATPLSVWDRKINGEPEVSTGKKKLFRRGKLWEQVVSEMLVAELESRDHRVTILNANKRYVDSVYGYMAAEIDYEIRLDDIPDIVNVELKTVHPNASKYWGPSDSDEMPLWYMAQGMYGLMVTGRKFCVLAPLFGADEIRIYPIARDEETIAAMREKARLFWELFVLPGKAPDPKTLEDVDLLYKVDADTSTFAEDWVVEKMLRFRATKAEIKARSAEADVLEFEIKRFMQTATKLFLPGEEKPAFTWKTQETNRLDMAAFKEAHPKLYREFLKKSKSRVFRMFNFSSEETYE